MAVRICDVVVNVSTCSVLRGPFAIRLLTYCMKWGLIVLIIIFAPILRIIQFHFDFAFRTLVFAINFTVTRLVFRFESCLIFGAASVPCTVRGWVWAGLELPIRARIDRLLGILPQHINPVQRTVVVEGVEVDTSTLGDGVSR